MNLAAFPAPWIEKNFPSVATSPGPSEAGIRGDKISAPSSRKVVTIHRVIEISVRITIVPVLELSRH